MKNNKGYKFIVCIYFKMVESITLAERIRAFDTSLGSDLERKGDSVLSQTQHEILRGLLGEAGYECTYFTTAFRTKDYPLSERNIYARPHDGAIDVFVEQNLEDLSAESGFSYLRLGVNGYNGFKRNYIRTLQPSTGYSLWMGGGILTSLFALFADNPKLVGSLVLGGVVNAVIALGLAIRDQNKAKERIKDLKPETNPRLAIQKALGYDPKL